MPEARTQKLTERDLSRWRLIEDFEKRLARAAQVRPDSLDPSWADRQRLLGFAGKVAYDPSSNQEGCTMRSRKLAALAATLVPPVVHGDAEGDLLAVGWGSTLGAIEEAVDRLRAQGRRVSSLHLRFLSPLEPGLAEIFARFRRVVTIEMNYSDRPGDPLIAAGSRRTGQLAQLLRERTLVDVDCWSVVEGQPIPPRAIVRELERRLAPVAAEAAPEEVPCTA